MNVRLAPLCIAACTLAACAPTVRPAATPVPVAARAVTPAATRRSAPRPDVSLPPAARRGPVSTLTAEEAAVQVADLFGVSLEARTGDAGDDAAVSWDIDVSYASRDRVEFYVNRFSGSAREPFAAWLHRGTRYEGMIRDKLHAAGLPEDLYYLALVESGFDSHAYSRAAAVGMWQFMTGTARGVGLRVDWWVDERRDPVRATEAAIRYLSELRDEFDGSLYLAAAAYNGGSGRVSRGLAKHADDLDGVEGDDRFFALAETGYLRAETREYVPQLIAAALVGKAPERYGIEVEPMAPFAYDSVLVPATTPIAAVARAAGAPVQAISDLNPQLLRGMTPPGATSAVRVPAGQGSGFADRLAALPDGVRRGIVARETTEHRGRLSRMASRHGLTERQLAWYNPGLKRASNGLLIEGQTVIVPSDAVVAAALDVADPSVERYGTSSAAPARTAAATRVHTVVSGESLDRIAHRYGLTVARLKSMNSLRSDLIKPGQRLKVTGGSTSASGKKSSASGSATTTARSTTSKTTRSAASAKKGAGV